MYDLKKYLMLVVEISILFFALNLSAQEQVIIKGRFLTNTPLLRVELQQFGLGGQIIARAAINVDSFSMPLPADLSPGVYRLYYAFGQEAQYLDLILNGKEQKLSFSLDLNKPYAKPKFSSSQENRRWYQYLAIQEAQLERISLLQQFLIQYPKREAEVFKAAELEWAAEKEEYQKRLAAFKRQMQGTWAYAMVANRPYYFPNPKQAPQDQELERYAHFWDSIDASNPALINTPLYPEHILNYLRFWLYPKQNISTKERQEGLKRATDTIMQRFNGAEATAEFAYQYLSKGFKQVGQEDLLQYLDQEYQTVAEQCLDAEEEEAFKQRMQGYAALKPGNLAPNVPLRFDSSGVEDLYTIKSENVLLVFWSSSCPHCLQSMPKVNQWAVEHPEAMVLGISNDIDTALYKPVRERFRHLVHSCDYQGWEGPAFASFYISATPTFIWLDEAKNIVEKYSSWDQFLEDWGRQRPK